MAGKTSKTSAKVARKDAAKRVAAKPVLLSGGNPQIAKADGDAPVQAYIAAMPGWKSDVGRRLDALIVRAVPGVRKAVKWNSPFYGIEGQGWFLNFHCFTKYIKVAFFRGASLQSSSPRRVQAQGRALPRHPRGRPARPGAGGELDRAGIGAARLGAVAPAGTFAGSLPFSVWQRRETGLRYVRFAAHTVPAPAANGKVPAVQDGPAVRSQRPTWVQAVV